MSEIPFENNNYNIEFKEMRELQKKKIQRKQRKREGIIIKKRKKQENKENKRKDREKKFTNQYILFVERKSFTETN